MRLPKFMRRSRSEPVSQEDLAKWFGGGESWSGIDVDRMGSLGVSAVWACVRLISEAIASLPLILYRRVEGGKERATEHPLYNLLHVQPNPEESAFQWREQKQAHVLLQGNCYSQKVLGGDGYVKELWPLDPDKMTPKREGGQIVYEYRPGGAQQPIVLPRQNVFHVAGLGYDGIKGYSVIETHANNIGARIAEHRYGSEFFKNGAQPGGYIKLVGSLKDEAARQRLRNSWEDMHGKWGNKHRVGVLEQGAEFANLSIPPEQAQFIETKKYGLGDVARIFGVPPHMIGDVERSTSWGTGIEQQGIGFVQYTLRAWLVRWEQALSLQLLPERDREEYFFEFLVDALLRGDMTARWASYRTAREIGVLSANDIRSLENMNPIENGDVYYVPMNWMTVDKSLEPTPEPTVTPPAPDEPPPEPSTSTDSVREVRAMRSAKSRKRLAEAHKATVRDAAARAVHREVRDLSEAAQKYMPRRSLDDWKEWLSRYYVEDFAPFLYRVMAPALEALAGSVRAAVADELDADVPDTPEIEKAIRGYIGAYVQRHGKWSQTVLESALRDLQNQDPLEVIENTLEGWEETRADRIANNETVGASNSFARTFYRALGVTALIWMAVGSEICPYCSQMAGRTVGIEQEFAMPGDALLDESGKLLEVQRKCATPPLHVGCVCQISAVAQRSSPRVVEKRRRMEVHRDAAGNLTGAEIVEEADG